MESGTLFMGYLLAWGFSCFAVHVYARQRQLNQGIVVMSHLAPSLVASAMILIFLVGGGATTVQFVAKSPVGLSLWSLWGDLWPLLLFLSVLSGVGNLAVAIVSMVKPEARQWTPVPVAGAIISFFAFVAVAANFPSA